MAGRGVVQSHQENYSNNEMEIKRKNTKLNYQVKKKYLCKIIRNLRFNKLRTIQNCSFKKRPFGKVNPHRHTVNENWAVKRKRQKSRVTSSMIKQQLRSSKFKTERQYWKIFQKPRQWNAELRETEINGIRRIVKITNERIPELRKELMYSPAKEFIKMSRIRNDRNCHRIC